MIGRRLVKVTCRLTEVNFRFAWNDIPPEHELHCRLRGSLLKQGQAGPQKCAYPRRAFGLFNNVAAPFHASGHQLLEIGKFLVVECFLMGLHLPGIRLADKSRRRLVRLRARPWAAPAAAPNAAPLPESPAIVPMAAPVKVPFAAPPRASPPTVARLS